MDALQECKFLLILLEHVKTLVKGYGAAPPVLQLNGYQRVQTTYIVTDDEYLRMAFSKIFKEEFPGYDDPRVKELAEAIETLLKGKK